jgi:hypothetical protein
MVRCGRPSGLFLFTLPRTPGEDSEDIYTDLTEFLAAPFAGKGRSIKMAKVGAQVC